MKAGQHAFGLGEPSDVLTLTPDLNASAAALTADDWMLLAQVGKSSTVGDVLSRSTLEETHTVALLERLLRLGVLSLTRAGEATPATGSQKAEAQKAPRGSDGAGAPGGRSVPPSDILELDGCGASREISEEQRTRAQSSVAAALEAARVSPVPVAEPRRFRAPLQGDASPFAGARAASTMLFAPSPLQGGSALGAERGTLPFGSSPVPFDAALSGGTLHFGPSPVMGSAALDGETLPFGASPVPFESPAMGSTLHFGASAGGVTPPLEGGTLPFGSSPVPFDAPLTGDTLHFGSPSLSPIPIVARFAAHEVTPPEGGPALKATSSAEQRTAPSMAPGELEENAGSLEPTPPGAQLSPDELEVALADTLISAPRPPELEAFLAARSAGSDVKARPQERRGGGPVTPSVTSALLLETEVFEGIGAGASAGAPPPLSLPDEPTDAEPMSAEASVVLAGLMSERAELVAELTEAATHGTATEPPDGEEGCAGHAEGLPFTPAPSVHNPGRARARESERPAREAKLPPNVYEEVLRLEGLASRGDLFAVFSLPRGASAAEVKKAFHSLSRRLHPDHYFHLGGGAQKARLEAVFRRISEAHATLVDPERRRAWAEANPTMSRPRATIERPVPRAPDAQQRDEERRERLARHPYLLKQAQPLIHLTQGKALLARGEFGEALESLERARAADPQNPEIARLLASAREGQKVRRAAEEEAQGRRAEEQGRLDEAVSCYRRAATLDPTNGAVVLQAARMLEREGGDLREARLFAQRAVELRPRDAEAQWLLAQILLRSGARKLARAPLEEVLRLQPKHPSARSQLRQLRLGL